MKPARDLNGNLTLIPEAEKP